VRPIAGIWLAFALALASALVSAEAPAQPGARDDADVSFEASTLGNDEALRRFGEAHKAHRNPRVLRRWAWVEYELNRYGEAIELLAAGAPV
jgi:hypothetical protein